MIEGIERLKEIGINEVAKKTHIEAEHIKWVVQSEFEKLAKYNVNGLIKVIERDCGVDLSSWLENFRKFKEEHPEFKRDSITVAPIINSYTPNMKKSKSGAGFFTMLLLLVLAGAAIWYFKLYQKFDFFPNPLDDKNRSATYSDNSAVESAEKKLKDKGISISENNITLVKISSQDDNISEVNSSQMPVLQPTHELNQTTFVAPKIIQSQENALSQITPKEKIWIGVIDVASGKKSSLITDKPFDIDMSKEQLIMTGHGMMSIQIDGKTENFNSKNQFRFYVKDGKITPIDYNEFLKLNRGKPW